MCRLAPETIQLVLWPLRLDCVVFLAELLCVVQFDEGRLCQLVDAYEAPCYGAPLEEHLCASSVVRKDDPGYVREPEGGDDGLRLVVRRALVDDRFRQEELVEGDLRGVLEDLLVCAPAVHIRH